MKRQVLLLSAVALLIFQVSCTKTGTETSNNFIHYTPETLDSVSLSLRHVLESSSLFPKTQEDVDSVFNYYAGLSYEEYGGAIPEFSQEFNLDTLVDNSGWITLKLTRKDETPEFNLLYIHGGAFFLHFDETIHKAICEAFIRRFNAAIYMPLYPLAPHHRVNEGMDMIMVTYNNLLAEGKKIYIMGDSAGGNFTLTFTLHLKELGIALPDAIFPISPCCDMRLDNPDIPEIEKRDPMLTVTFAKTVTAWVEEGMSIEDPLVSPIYGDMKGMPRTLFFIGSDDILCPDTMLTYEKMKDAGVEVGMLYGNKLWHVAPTFDIPVQDQYLDEVAAFI